MPCSQLGVVEIFSISHTLLDLSYLAVAFLSGTVPVPLSVSDVLDIQRLRVLPVYTVGTWATLVAFAYLERSLVLDLLPIQFVPEDIFLFVVGSYCIWGLYSPWSHGSFFRTFDMVAYFSCPLVLVLLRGL
jgi:hypothetical protein